MEIEYTTYQNRDGTFHNPCLDVTFRYKSRAFFYRSALVDTGSDFVMLPMEIAEAVGLEPDFDMVTELHCACGNSFPSYASRYPVEIHIDYAGFRPKVWQTHVRLVDAKVTPLLGQRGFLDRFDVTFCGKRHVMRVEER
jgi:hypothetical protein